MSRPIDEAMAAVLGGPPDDPLIEADGVWVTRGAVAAIAAAIDARLAAAGVAGDAPIGLVARNRVAQVAALFGLLARRRTIVMLHAYQAPAMLADDLRRLNLAAIIAGDDDWAAPALADAARAAGSVGILLSDDVKYLAGAETPGPGPHHPPQPDVAIHMLTSGTTGTPKRVPIGYDMLAAATADAGLATVQAGTPFTAAPFVQLYPLGNISGLYGLITCATQGQRIVLIEKFGVAEWVRAVETYRPTSFVSLPPAAIRMVMDAAVPRAALASIPALRCGSAPLDPALQAAFEERYGIPVLVNYGATEFAGVIANWTIDDHRRFAHAKRGSVGRARPGTLLRVVDPDTGEPRAAGEQGVLEVRSERLGGGWIRTTDLGVIDADGFLFLRGRADSVIIRGGFKVSPEAVAAILREHPAIRDAAIVSRPDPRLGEVPIAAIEPVAADAPPEPAELLAFARARMAPQMVPVRFELFDALPRTASMKVDRARLQALVAARS